MINLIPLHIVYYYSWFKLENITYSCTRALQ